MSVGHAAAANNVGDPGISRLLCPNRDFHACETPDISLWAFFPCKLEVLFFLILVPLLPSFLQSLVPSFILTASFFFPSLYVGCFRRAVFGATIEFACRRRDVSISFLSVSRCPSKLCVSEDVSVSVVLLSLFRFTALFSVNVTRCIPNGFEKWSLVLAIVCVRGFRDQLTEAAADGVPRKLFPLSERLRLWSRVNDVRHSGSRNGLSVYFPDSEDMCVKASYRTC